jgi:hypothetical protein
MRTPFIPLNKRVFLSRRPRTAVVCVVVLCLQMLSSGFAQDFVTGPRMPEDWALTQIKLGKEVDFNEHCGSSILDPRAADNRAWGDRCRSIPGDFIANLMTDTSLRNLPSIGIKIVGARIRGDINLQNTKLDRALAVRQSLFDGSVNLDAAHAEGVLDFFGSSFIGPFSAQQIRCDLSLDLQFAELRRDLILTGAKIESYFALDGAVIIGALEAASVSVGGNLFLRSVGGSTAKLLSANLSSARIIGSMYMDGAMVEGDLNAEAVIIGGSLSMHSIPSSKSRFHRTVLSNAKVAGSIDLTGATFLGELTADALDVGVSLFMQSTSEDKALFKSVILNSAKINANVNMDGSTFGGPVEAYSVFVGGSVFIQSSREQVGFLNDVMFTGARIIGNLEMSRANIGQINLNGASVSRNVVMEDISVKHKISGHAIHVGASMFLNRGRVNEVELTNARILGDLEMDGVLVEGEVNGNSLQVGESFFFRDATDYGRVRLNFAQIAGNLDFRGTVVAELDLSGSVINGDLRISSPKNKRSFWRLKERKSGDLSLRNARVTNLVDTRDAWPAAGHLHLSGFRFVHLGGFEDGKGSDFRDDGGGSEQEMRSRGMEWWDKWVQLDQEYSPTPYEQLAAVLTATGDREAADEIRYLGRVQQRKTESWLTWIVSGFLQYAAGFGIGGRTFRVLYWVLAISAAGALYLWKCVPAARKRGMVWCFGASVSQLLPIVELNKEFTDFFNDPERTRLTNFQIFIFAGVAVFGWLLGAILVAAVSGLTQKP